MMDSFYVLFMIVMIPILYYFPPRVVPGIYCSPKGYYSCFGHLFKVLPQLNKLIKFRLNEALEAEAHGEKCYQINLPFSNPIIQLIDPDLIQHVIKTEAKKVVKGSLWDLAFHDILGQGIFNVDGVQWLHQRKIASHLFTSKFLKNVTHIFVEHAFQVSGHLIDHGNVDLQEVFYRYTMECFAKIGFGIDFATIDATAGARFTDSFDRLQAMGAEIIMTPKPMHLIAKYKYNAEIKRLVKIVDEIIYQLIAIRRDSLKKNSEDDKEEAADLFSRFLDQCGPNESIQQQNRTMRDVLANFLIGGRDTTASTLTNLFLYLARYPAVKEKLLTELEDISCESAETFNTSDLDSCVYLDAVIHEVLRLSPPISSNLRIANEDIPLPHGPVIPKGSTLFYCGYILHRLKSVWGPDADKFDPDRWIKTDDYGKRSLKSESAFKFISFHAGPRMCLGKPMALLETRIMAAIMLKTMDIDVEAKKFMAVKMSITTAYKDGLKAQVKAKQMKTNT